jgi:predicted nuclease of predicted toxin-antitoxin system
MRIKLDENLPYGLVVELSALGHDVDTVPQEGLTGQADDAVWSAAQLSQRFLITQDLDFSDIRKFTPGTHHGLLLVRLQQAGRKDLIRRVRSLFLAHDVASWQGCYVVATEIKVRIQHPPPRPGG